jgi:hypothetical protein
MQQIRRTNPVYTLHGVVIATLLGSVAGAVAILCLNYISFNRPKLARKTAIAGFIVFVILDVITATTTGSITFGSVQWLTIYFAITLGQIILAYAIAKQLQGQTIKYHLNNGGSQHSSFRAAGVGLITAFALVFVSVFLSIIFGTAPNTPS